MTILTKADILKGIDNPKKVLIESLNGELWLRPLSSAEVNEITNIEAQGYGTFNASNNQGRTETQGKMNLSKMQEKQNEAKYTAIHKSINNEKNSDEWSLDDLKHLPSNSIDEIYKSVMEISGVDITEREVQNFPEDK